MNTTKQYISILLLATCSLILASCDEDSFSTVVEVDLSEYGNQLVVLAPFQPDFPSADLNHFQLKLVKSNDILNENSDFQPITNATVDIYEEGELFVTLFHSENGNYGSPIGKGPKVGKDYRIEINSTDFGKTTAESQVPNKPQILQAYISDENYYDASEEAEKIEVTFEIKDELDVANYYYLTVNSIIDDGIIEPSYWNVCFSTSDPAFDEDEYNDDFFEVEETPTNYYCDGFATFRDLIFEGETKIVKIYVDKYYVYDYTFDPETGESQEFRRDIQVVFGAMSRDIYNYKRSARTQSWNEDNPFAEPIRVYSNIEGGIGIFGGFVETSVILE
ncbi:MAG: DUF4249 family protein [Chitinophagales bacterium]